MQTAQGWLLHGHDGTGGIGDTDIAVVAVSSRRGGGVRDLSRRPMDFAPAIHDTRKRRGVILPLPVLQAAVTVSRVGGRKARSVSALQTILPISRGKRAVPRGRTCRS